jgi:hypothetical protein
MRRPVRIQASKKAPPKAVKLRWRMKAPGEIQRTLREVARRYADAFAAALYQEGLALDALANSNDYIPVDTGRLRATHYVAPPVITGKRIRVEVGYGVEYAIYVHERRELRHPVGRAQWLLAAFAVRASGFFGRLAARTLQNAKKGVGVKALQGRAPARPGDPGPSPSKRAEAKKKATAKKRERAKATRERRREREKQRKATARERKRAKRKTKAEAAKKKAAELKAQGLTPKKRRRKRSKPKKGADDGGG